MKILKEDLKKEKKNILGRFQKKHQGNFLSNTVKPENVWKQVQKRQ